MDRFIHDENLKLWRRHLAETTAPKERAVLVNLIRSEQRRENKLGNHAKEASDSNGHGACQRPSNPHHS
jgi:hypothetical protein